jgi:hypothetical protein
MGIYNFTYLNLNWSPSESVSFGIMSNTPVNGKGWPPYAYSTINNKNYLGIAYLYQFINSIVQIFY